LRTARPFPHPPFHKLPPPERRDRERKLINKINSALQRIEDGTYGYCEETGLITVEISEKTAAESIADTQTRRESSTGGSIGRFFGAVKGATENNPNLGPDIGFEATGGSQYRGDGSTKRAGTLTGMLTCRVVEQFPNGNLRIWGWKEIRTNRETQYLVLTGIIRPRDIRASNVIMSDFVAELQLGFDGSGVVADKQGPGIGHRVMDHAWPF
jgi:flagellar L-ring protein precursor FlgH